MYSRWAEDPVAPDFIPSTETVVSSIAEDETIDIDSRSLEPSEFAVASRPPSDVLSRSGGGAADNNKQEGTSVAKEDLDKTFDLSINGDDEEEGGCCTSSSNEEYADNSKLPAHQNTPNTQATYACEPSSQTMFSLDITEVLHDAEARADNEYLEGSYHHWYNKDYRYCPIRLGGPRTPQIVLMMLALSSAALGVVGAVVPNVPSMPFVLLSGVFSFAFCLGSVSYLGRPVN
uniref:Uncharacterized protein n=1 Tax=Minutocellus polymorphus TaxID=265543 RepID=A0A7S0FM24_9STRA|mmetsp:Transcript_1883/g.3136  ORF Transcript_1883/g.3136 Transcript_1883/m.3136 type:complete len:232 (+) Transcript_1883:313-1008(+)